MRTSILSNTSRTIPLVKSAPLFTIHAFNTLATTLKCITHDPACEIVTTLFTIHVCLLPLVNKSGTPAHFEPRNELPKHEGTCRLQIFLLDLQLGHHSPSPMATASIVINTNFLCPPPALRTHPDLSPPSIYCP